MSEFENIQRLIRLKRHERPSEDFVEHFVSTFQERQRSELLRHSARGLLWERVTTYVEGLLNPKWAWAGATAVAVLGLGMMLRPMTHMGTTQVAQNGSVAVSGKKMMASERAALDADIAQYLNTHRTGLDLNLISHHYGGGFGDEQSVPDLQLGGISQGKVYPAGFYVDLENGLHR